MITYAMGIEQILGSVTNKGRVEFGEDVMSLLADALGIFPGIW